MKITMEMILKDYNLLGFVDESERKSFIDVVHTHPEALKYFPIKTQTRKLIKPFLKIPHIFSFLKHSILKTEEISYFLEKKPDNYNYLNTRLKKNIIYMKSVIKGNVESMILIPEEYQTQELIDFAFNHPSKDLSFIAHSNPAFITLESLIQYIEKYPDKFYSLTRMTSFSKTDMVKDSKFIETAIRNHGANIRYIENPSIDLCLLALENDPNCYEDISIVESTNGEEAKNKLLGKKEILALMSGNTFLIQKTPYSETIK